MMVLKNNQLTIVKQLLLLLLLVLVANWFFTFQLVCLKDDNSFYYMPVRMYLSDALHKGGLPYWNPYLMNGVPQYADMQGAVWNPIAFTFCYVFKYNHTLFLTEYIVYILLAAIGAYKLFSLITNNKLLLFTAATIYICNGFVSGIANFINWTASLAFIPWVLYFFFSILQKPTYQKSIALGVASWLMLVCGYPAFIVYTTYCLMAIVLFFFIKAIQQKELNIVLKKIGFLLLGLCIALLLSLPALMAYIEFLPFYNRGKDLATDLPFRDCFYPQFLSSLFIPSSVYSKTYDLLCHSANRDIYFGVLPLITVVLFAGKLKKIRTPFIILLTSIAIFTFVFLFGFLTPLGNFSFNYLPLMGSFKWSAAARVFLILLCIAAIVYYLQHQKFTLTNHQTITVKIICIGMLIGIVVTFYFTNQYAVFETTKHKQVFYLNTVVQIVLAIIILLKTNTIFKKPMLFCWIVVVDLLLNYSIGMAITGIGNVPPKVFNNYATSFYKQQPNEYLKHPLALNRKLYMFNPWTNHNASKIMNGATFLMSNTIFSGYEKIFIQDTSNERILRNHAFAFSEDVDSVVIHSANINYTNIDLSIFCNKPGNIVLQQNNYYKWKEVNNLPIRTWNNCFMQLPVKAGVNNIHLQYNKGNYWLWMKLSYLFLMLLLAVYLFGSRNKILTTQRQP